MLFCEPRLWGAPATGQGNRCCPAFGTHDLKVAANLCDEVAVMYAGDFGTRARRKVLREPLHPHTGTAGFPPENGLHPYPRA